MRLAVNRLRSIWCSLGGSPPAFGFDLKWQAQLDSGGNLPLARHPGDMTRLMHKQLVAGLDAETPKRQVVMTDFVSKYMRITELTVPTSFQSACLSTTCQETGPSTAETRGLDRPAPQNLFSRPSVAYPQSGFGFPANQKRQIQILAGAP